MSSATAWLGFVLWAAMPPALPMPRPPERTDYDVAPRRPGPVHAAREEMGHETLWGLWRSRRSPERPCEAPPDASLSRGAGWREHARASLTLRACGRDDLAWEHERFLVVEARVALPAPWMQVFVETTIRLQKTLEVAPTLAAHGAASAAFWRELVVDAVADLGTPSEARALDDVGLALKALARRGPGEKELPAALEVLANYPPSHALDERLMVWARPPFDREQRLALWRLVARRAAAQAPPAAPATATFEAAVRRSDTPEAWIALAELWREQGQPSPRVESAWQEVRFASPERLAYWDSIGAERRAARESEELALVDKTADRRAETLRRWVKLGDLDRARGFWDHVLSDAPRDRATLLWLVHAAVQLHDPDRLTQASASLLRLNARDDDGREVIGEAWLAVGDPKKAIATWKVLGRGDVSRLATLLVEHDLPEDARAVVARASTVSRPAPFTRVTALAFERERRRDDAFRAWWALHEDARAEDGLHEEATRHLLALIPMVRAATAVPAATHLEDRVARVPSSDDIALLVKLARHLGRGDEARAALQGGVRTWLDVHAGSIGAADRATLASFSAAFRELRADQEEESLWRRLNDGSRAPCLWCRWQQALSALRRGGFADAEDDLRLATLMEPDADLDSRLAELAERIGRLDFARSFYERALRVRPEDDATRLALSRLYLRTDDRNSAWTTLRVAPPPTSADGRARLPDLVRQDLEEARRDQGVWDGSPEAPSPMTAADIVARLYELDKPSADAPETHDDRRSRLEALHLAGLRGRERRLPFRWPSPLARTHGELVCGLIWYAANAGDPGAAPLLRDVLRSSSNLAPLAVLALARVAPREAADLSLSLLRDPGQSDPMIAAAALALAATPPDGGDDSVVDALRATALRREGLAGRAADRALGARLARFLPGPLGRLKRRETPESAAVAMQGGQSLSGPLPWTCESPAPAESLVEVLTESAPCTAQFGSTCR